MFSTVRYFIKTSLIFVAVGLLTGIYMSVTKYIAGTGIHPGVVSAHTHIILVGGVMMMIMGVALWFFPRAEKDDKKYKPELILFTYWLMTGATGGRFLFQIAESLLYQNWLGYLVSALSILQAAALVLFFYSMWGRIRSVGSHLREAKGEKF